MKAVFLSYNQALTDRVNAILDEQGIRGFTRWALTGLAGLRLEYRADILSFPGFRYFGFSRAPG